MRQESLDFLIEQNDYFATVLDLIRQDLDRRELARHAATLARLHDDSCICHAPAGSKKSQFSKCCGRVVQKLGADAATLQLPINYRREENTYRQSMFAPKSGVDNDPQSIYFAHRRRSKGLVQIKIANPK